MKNFKNLTLDDYEIISKFFQEHPPEISEYTFTNLYMWRNWYKFQWNIIDNQLFIISLREEPKIVAFLPVGDNPIRGIQILDKIAKEYEQTIVIERVPQSIIEQIKESPIDLKIEEDRDNWDYVYLRSDLADLPGKGYQNIRKKLNKFKKRNNWEYEPINEENLAECLKLQECWCEWKDCEGDSSLIYEHAGIKDILENYHTLRYTGGVLRIDGKIVGFSLSEQLNENTNVCHVEKSDPTVTGVYQAINQLFAEHLSEKIKFINREQDLGEENLRYSKLAYKPHKFIKKYKIFVG